MKVLYFVNEAPAAFPSALAIEINRDEKIDVLISSFYNNIDDRVQTSIRVESLDASTRFDTKSYKKLRGLIVDENIDIVHTHPNSTGAIARLVASTTDVSIVDTRHNDHRHFSAIQRMPNLLATGVTDKFISNSKSTRDSFSKIENTILRMRGGGHEVVYNGIDPTIADDARDASPVTVDGPMITCVARYVEQKNHETIVRSMEHVTDHIPEAKLVLVGDGPRYDEIEAFIEEQDLTDCIIQTGYLPEREDVFATVAESDLFAISSRYEGFCVAAVEAMLLGTPIVASDIDVLREVLSNAAVFAPYDNPTTFADRIVSLLNDESKREELSSTGQQRARDIFPLSRTAQGYIEVYRDLVKETP
jgi:glycosyltransferase involved in cell wall biosynthesis